LPRRANHFDRFYGVRHSASNSAKTHARKNEFRKLIQADSGCRLATHKHFYFGKSELVLASSRLEGIARMAHLPRRIAVGDLLR